jgi:hypothetical protein
MHKIVYKPNFLFALLLSLSFFGPMVAYLIIYNKTNKIKKRHRKFEQEAALSGGCDVTAALPPYISRTWLPVCLFGNRSVFGFGFMFGNRFVRDESRSTTEVPLYMISLVRVFR